MQLRKLVIFIVFITTTLILSGQGNPDSLITKKYPLKIGNIGFGTDSVEVVLGDVPRGEITSFQYEIYNFGKDEVIFTGGKSNKFINTSYTPSALLPQSSGVMTVDFDALSELNLGDFNVEVMIESNDDQNPYKFLSLLMNLVEGSNPNNFRYDNVPHIVFDHYNHDFGHLRRGKVIYHTFILTNNGGEPLYVLDVVPPKGITIVDSPVMPVMPDEKSIIRLKINTRGRVGIQHNTVLVHTNDPESPLVILGLHGSVKVYPTHKKTENQCGEGRNNF